MPSDPRPDEERDALLTPELAKTELAKTELPPSNDASRTGPRPVSGTAPSGAPALRAIGRFRIDAQLGAGGMGDVYRAYDPVLDRAVALKVLRIDRSADDQQRMRRVVREARAAAALTHPNTVTIFEVGEADREVFIAMELLEGEDLRAVVERGEASTADKLRWLLEAARALGAAHERGLVHRDVKPENMFVCKGGTLKLLDFGIAKREDDDPMTPGPAVDMGPSSLRTTEGRRIGTPRYMAPEQHAGDATDPRTDEYAWGLVAYELLAGAHVVADLRTQTTDGGTVSPAPTLTAQRLDVLRASAPDVSETVLRAVTRALEPRKEDRFPSMAPIVEALEGKTEAPTTPVEKVVETPPPTPPPPTTPPATAPPATTPPPRRSWIVLPAVAALVALGLYALRVATHSPDAVGAASAPRPVVTAACRIASSRALAVGPDDRVATLPDGTVMVARDVHKAISLHKLTDAGTEPLPPNPFTSSLAGSFRDLRLAGVTHDGEPATFVQLDQDERGVFIGLFGAKSMSSQRIFGIVNGVAAATFGSNVMVVATTPDIPVPRISGFPNGAEAYLIGHTAGVHHTTIEEGGAAAPAVAARHDRVAVAYVFRDDLHFAMLDGGLSRIGDVQTIAHTTSSPAVAYAPDDVPVVLWVDDGGGKTRLYVSARVSGDSGTPAFSPPKMAIDEPLALRAPVTAQLPDGSWVVAWIAGSGGLSTLRLASIGPGGALAGVTDLAKGPRIDGLRAVATGKGVDLWWYESDALVRIADVECAPPFSAKMSRP